MSEILITQVPAAPIDIDVITGRVLTVTSPPEVYLPYIGANGHWWVGGIDSDIPARGEPGEKGSDGLPGKDGANGKDGQNTDPALLQEMDARSRGYMAAEQKYDRALRDGSLR